ncbi:MAG TPA: VWA domain-containing protein, partial [Polyangiaceae bacterium]|nr:VWA domain-containing protein [Polyangiaceae bacterium]
LPASRLAGVPGSHSDYLLAAAAHASAHLRFGAGRFEVKALGPLQLAVISLIEDARVERLARQTYPGLARIWWPFYLAQASGAKTSDALLARLSRALHDETFEDGDGWVQKASTLFFEASPAWSDPALSERIGNALANDLGQMRVQFNAKTHVVEPAYRDDHAGLWQQEHGLAQDGSDLESEGAWRAAEPHPETKPWERRLPQVVSARMSTDAERESGERVQTSSVVDPPIEYPEWDYLIARERPAFCALREKPMQLGNVSSFAASLARYAPTRRHLARAALRLATRRPVPLRRLFEGDRLDLSAAVTQIVARVGGTRCDARVYRRSSFRPEPPALLLLLDLSQSLNDTPAGASNALLELARDASGLLATTLSGVVRDWAIHGFSSNGRRDVGYYRFKDFDEPYDDRVRARLAGMCAQLSTRLGAALRHAGHSLQSRAASRKLLLIVTDGEPADVDVHDAKYLIFDAKHATEVNRQRGVTSFCVGLDPGSQNSVERIFGAGRYLLVDRLDGLPHRLSELFLRLAG